MGRGRHLRQYLQLLSSSVAWNVGLALYALLTSRWLSVPDRGSLVIVLSAANLISVIASGGLGVEGRRRLTAGSDDIHVRYDAAAFQGAAASMALAIAIGPLVVAFADCTMPLFSIASLVTLVGFQTIQGAYIAAFIGLGRLSVMNYIVTTSYAAMLLLLMLLHLLGAVTYVSAMSLAMLASAFGAIALSIHFRAHHRLPVLGFRSIGNARLYVESIRAVPGPLGQQALGSLDRIVLGIVSGPGAVALYAVGASLAAIPVMVAAPNSQLVLNETSRTPTRVWGRSEWFALGATGALCLGLAFAAPWLVPHLFGEAYVAAVPITAVSLITGFTVACRRSQLSTLQGRGRHQEVAAGSLFSVVGTIGLMVPLALAGGALGAAVAVLVGSLGVVVYWAWACKRSLRLLRADSRG